MADDFRDFEYDLTNTMRVTKAKEDGFREVTQDVSSHLAWAKEMRAMENSRNGFYGRKVCGLERTTYLDKNRSRSRQILRRSNCSRKRRYDYRLVNRPDPNLLFLMT